jgi:hypothetical protein
MLVKKLSLMTARLVVAGLVLTAPALAVPPPPPGGHIPVYLGGANQGGYPPLGAGIEGSELQAAPALAEVSSAPNPFRGTTAIRFTLAGGAEARLSVFDLAGRQVREIVHRASQSGSQSVAWDGRGAGGDPLASGVYFFQLSAGDRAVTRRLVLLR